MRLRLTVLKAALALIPLALTACAGVDTTRGATPKLHVPADATAYEMRWEHRPESDAWTQSALNALRSYGAPLPDMVPRDIETWCPGYATASQEDREAFWIGLVSALAKHESTWNPGAVGGGGKWFGLVQIAPGTARSYGCNAKSGSALKNGSDNVSCAIRILARTVPRDGVVAAGNRGAAADWGPFHSSSKRADMINWTRSQPFCQPKAQAKGVLKAKTTKS